MTKTKISKALRIAVALLCAIAVLMMIVPAANAQGYTLLIHGSTGGEVTRLQQALHDKGYLTVTPTGYFGPLTQDAVIRFQRDNGLIVDGLAGNQTQTALYAVSSPAPASTGFSPTVRQGSSGWAVTELQQMLERFGYLSPGNVTGSFGSVTHTAVLSFQRANGLAADGIVGRLTWTRLFSSSVVYAESINAGRIADIALAQNGKPYVLGGNGPSVYDCSGLVYYALTNAGYNVQRLSAAAYSEYSAWTRITGTSALKKGDLLFFRSDTSANISHMGVYTGNGQFVHASSGQSRVMVSELGNSYWARNYVFARRVG